MKLSNVFLRLFLLGFLTWFIPFAASFFFYTREGVLTVPYGFFKSIMIVTGSVSGAICLILYFKKVNSAFLKQGIITGVSWFLLNILLDAIVLIPMMKTSFIEYFTTIGLGYIVIPVFSITAGYLIQTKKSTL